MPLYVLLLIHMPNLSEVNHVCNPEHSFVVCRWLLLPRGVTIHECPIWGRGAPDWYFGTQTYLVLFMPPRHTTASKQPIAFRTSPLMSPEVRHTICALSAQAGRETTMPCTHRNWFLISISHLWEMTSVWTKLHSHCHLNDFPFPVTS